ncbi:MAG: GNAT family N-acetyltransferase [Thermoplasmata archaeon]
MRPPTIRFARRAEDIESVRSLFREYRQWHLDHRRSSGLSPAVLRTGLSYLDAEIASLPGEFAPPRGALILAREDGHPVGCGALRPWDRDVGEIKRVYVRSTSRGHGVGLRIARALLAAAHDRRYERVVLDTLPSMAAAIRIYRRLGFVPTSAYWAHPVANALYFEYRFRRPFSRPSRKSSGRSAA